jgi:hypothetical protein
MMEHRLLGLCGTARLDCFENTPVLSDGLVEGSISVFGISKLAKIVFSSPMNLTIRMFPLASAIQMWKGESSSPALSRVFF